MVLKIVFAAGLLFWLASSGKLDFSLVSKSFKIGPQWYIALGLIFIQLVLNAIRYKLLLETKSEKTLRFMEIFRLNYIGLFFSSVIPGAVTGDIIKLVYIKKLSPKFNKTFLITITLLDRIMGVTGLLFLAGIFSAVYYGEVTALSPKLAHVIMINFLLFAGAAFFLVMLISPKSFQTKILKLIRSLPLFGKKIEHILSQVFALRENRKNVFKSFLLSVLSQFISVLSFWTVISPFINNTLPFKYAFTFIPVGMITTAIPISPGGLGVGHALFANLFLLAGIQNGASLFNLFYLCNLLNNAVGVFPYLLISKKITVDQRNF